MVGNSTPAPSASQSVPPTSTPVSVTTEYAETSGAGNLNVHVLVHVQERMCNPDCIEQNHH